ncbi:uncharacterized protein LY79DRAFT_335712 [Colletotrichum navitas]|uniref:Uncharacterized protein n=1 Tax=Colletotrichum navitas TaxID=681940 RepID=A0AAD8PTL8_9PEZI|nr:uncharacterized protein LY79DRAFT_335712 [Colletotrichum navitas]KAK1579808.1 hypothetical protein LY79DRAFT_335712 [Colletotrichum navitas]
MVFPDFSLWFSSTNSAYWMQQKPLPLLLLFSLLQNVNRGTCAVLCTILASMARSIHQPSILGSVELGPIPDLSTSLDYGLTYGFRYGLGHSDPLPPGPGMSKLLGVTLPPVTLRYGEEEE